MGIEDYLQDRRSEALIDALCVLKSLKPEYQELLCDAFLQESPRSVREALRVIDHDREMAGIARAANPRALMAVALEEGFRLEKKSKPEPGVFARGLTYLLEKADIIPSGSEGSVAKAVDGLSSYAQYVAFIVQLIAAGAADQPALPGGTVPRRLPE